MSYTEVTISGYNSSPPVDDGSTGPTNQVKWASIKSKLFDPFRTALELIDDRVASAIETADTALATLQSGVSTLSTQVTGLATALTAPSGTVMLFAQTSAPTGWSKSSSFDDYAIRLVTGSSGGASGGSTAFSTILTARTISTEHLPSHSHTFVDASSTASFSGTTSFVHNLTAGTDSGPTGGSKQSFTDLDNSNVTVTGSWSFSVSSDSSGSGGTWDFAVQYVDVILASKS